MQNLHGLLGTLTRGLRLAEPHHLRLPAGVTSPSPRAAMGMIQGWARSDGAVAALGREAASPDLERGS